MQHHKDHYPVGKLCQPAPYRDGGGTYAFGPIILSIWALAFKILPKRLFALFFFESALFLYVSDHLHAQYHIQGSYLERYSWFLERRYRHFWHHGHLRQNMSLGGIDTIFDKLFGTYMVVKENSPLRSSCIGAKRLPPQECKKKC